MAMDLSATRTTQALFSGGVEIYSTGSRRACAEDWLGQTSSPPANLGVCGRQIYYRSDLVVLFVLDTGLPATRARIGAAEDRATDRHDLPDGGCGQRGWRMVFIMAHSSRQERETGLEPRGF